MPDKEVELPEGARVTVIAEGDQEKFATTSDEETELEESIAEADRDEVVEVADLFRRLSR